MFPSQYLTLFSVRMKLYHKGRVGVEGVPAVTGREAGRQTGQVTGPLQETLPSLSHSSLDS